jgi:hypothetical protein
MTNDPKSTKDTPPEAPAQPAAEMAPYMIFAELYHNGVERLAELQKKSIDIFAMQATEAIGVWKKTVPAPAQGGLAWMDLADQGIAKVAQAQKGMIDLAVQQSAQNAQLAKGRREPVNKWPAEMTAVMSEAADRAVAAHKISMDFAAAQNTAISAVVKKQSGISCSAPAAAALDAMEHNVDMAIRAQKDMVEAAAKPLKAAAGAKQAA